MLRADRGEVATGGKVLLSRNLQFQVPGLLGARMEYIRGLCSSTLEGVAKINTATRWAGWLATLW